MISKELMSEELMSEVLKLNITYIERYNNSIIYKISVYDREEEVNIYELAYKCKEWAFYAYKISVSSFKSGSFYLREFNQIKDNSEYWVELDTASIDCEINIDDSGIFKSCSEPEAIFKACQWILDNKQKRGNYENN